jgi:hypothetical protein
VTATALGTRARIVGAEYTPFGVRSMRSAGSTVVSRSKARRAPGAHGAQNSKSVSPRDDV